AKVAIQAAMRVRPLAAGRALVEAVGGPLLYALEEPDRKAIFIGFDLFKTDFPLRVAFPLILSNTLRWLHPAALDQSSLQLAAGQPILLPVAHGISSATVNTPSGRAVKALVTRGVVSFTDTDEVGIYTLSTARGVVLLLTLLRPALPRWVDRRNVVFLLDHSDSVSLVARERAYRFVSEAVRHLKSGDRHEVIVFGEEAVVDQPLSNRPSVERPKAAVSGRGTNIFQAIQLALATVTPGHANRIVMLTDGRQNAGNALAGAQAAKDA